MRYTNRCLPYLYLTQYTYTNKCLLLAGASRVTISNSAVHSTQHESQLPTFDVEDLIIDEGSTNNVDIGNLTLLKVTSFHNFTVPYL